jgi:hypothetical protein
MMTSEMLETIDVTPSVEMNEREAREAVDDIKKGINTVRARIYELDRRKGWKALGYRSFTACCMDQFPELHAKYVEKQLAAARVDAVLKEFPPNGGKIEELPESHARELVSLRHDPEALKSAYEKAVDIADAQNDGRVTAQIITQAVQESKPEYEWTKDELDRRATVEAGGTVVANMHQETDRALLTWARKTDRFVRIDRNSELGNPFELGPDGDRDTVCDSFEIYFGRKYSLHDRVLGLEGKVLGCWCYPERCHGNHFIKLIEGKAPYDDELIEGEARDDDF